MGDHFPYKWTRNKAPLFLYGPLLYGYLSYGPHKSGRGHSRQVNSTVDEGFVVSEAGSRVPIQRVLFCILFRRKWCGPLSTTGKDGASKEVATPQWHLGPTRPHICLDALDRGDHRNRLWIQRHASPNGPIWWGPFFYEDEEDKLTTVGKSCRGQKGLQGKGRADEIPVRIQDAWNSPWGPLTDDPSR